MSRLVVTGAGGFLGRHIVAASRAAGHKVLALTRGAMPAEWTRDNGIETWQTDLNRAEDLAPRISGAQAIIHAAAGSGNDRDHERDTIASTEALLAALEPQARLVLVSSFSVYAAAALPDGAMLDETAPVEAAPAARRDAYARAKLGQERAAIGAVQRHGIDLRIARAGVIWGQGREWSARLGWRRGRHVLCPGGGAALPAIHVEDCAALLVALAFAEGRDWPNDVPVPRGEGRIHILNLLSSDLPSQSEWITALGLSARFLPYRPVLKAAGLLDLAADLWPALDQRLPTALREVTLAARFKPLRYATARLEDRLGPLPRRDLPTALRALSEGS